MCAVLQALVSDNPLHRSPYHAHCGEQGRSSGQLHLPNMQEYRENRTPGQPLSDSKLVLKVTNNFTAACENISSSSTRPKHRLDIARLSGVNARLPIYLPPPAAAAHLSSIHMPGLVVCIRQTLVPADAATRTRTRAHTHVVASRAANKCLTGAKRPHVVLMRMRMS